MSDIKTTIGNFLTQSNQDFPHDCELYEGMQSNLFLVSMIGNLAGDKMILQGCELENNGTRRGKGYVFLHTQDYPQGEVLFWEGGNISGGMFIKLASESVSVQGNDYPDAYTIRTLSPGIGEENYDWKDFKELITIPQLQQKVTSLQNEVLKVPTPEIGFIKMWTGTAAPANYLLCDGQQYPTSSYPELYSIIGTTYNNKPNYNGVVQSTTAGYFRVPDLRGRFVVGCSNVDTNYTTVGLAGGKKTVALSLSEMPSHTHTQNLPVRDTDTWKGGGNPSPPYCITNYGRTSIQGSTNSTGSGVAHENRPPYYTLTYVIQAK